MRSTQIVIFLVILNFSAVMMTAAVPGLTVDGFGAESDIEETAAYLDDRDVNQPSSDEITGSFLGGANVIERISKVVFYGPEMLSALGLPRLLVTMFELVLVFVVAFDIFEAVTNRRMS